MCIRDSYYGFQGQNGFSYGNDSSSGISPISLFPDSRKDTVESRELAPQAEPINPKR